MYDVITIGSSLVDIFVASSEFSIQKSEQGLLLCQTYGEKIDVDSFTVCSGGGGSNTAVGFSRMGFTVASITETGKDAWADVIVKDFHTESVATNLVIHEKKEATGGSVILIGKDGGRTVLVHRGASSQLDPKDIPITKLTTAKWVHLSSISGRLDTLKTIFSILKRKKSKLLSWNPGKKELELLREREIHSTELPAEIFMVNKEEWELLAGVRDELIATIPQLLITDGANGVELIVHGSRRKFYPKAVESVDDTGAGDSFIVGFVAAQLYGQLPETAMAWAATNARSVVGHIGSKAGLCSKEYMERHASV